MLAPLLAELGLGDARPAPALAPAHADGCQRGDWNLADVGPAAAPDEVACHAILVGSLMPDFMSRMYYLAQASAPDRLAWLARAWVEATSLAPTVPTMRSVAALASVQLRLDLDVDDTSGQVDSSDVVARPLARVLWAYGRTRTMPQSSRDGATTEYLGAATDGLPAFAKAVAAERARFTLPFRDADLCPMQLALPHFRTPSGCDEDPVLGKGDTAPASLSQSQLVEDWRLAQAWSALYVEGIMRGSASGIADVLHDLPPRIAAHPFMLQMHYAVRDHETHSREAVAHLADARERLKTFATAMATLQRDDALIHLGARDETPLLPAEQSDPVILKLQDDLRRLAAMNSMDFFAALQWRPEIPAAEPAAFLADGNFAEAQNAIRMALHPSPSPAGLPMMRAASAASAASAGMPPWGQKMPPPFVMPGVISEHTFRVPSPFSLPDKRLLEGKLAANPDDMPSRVGLALIALEHGAGVSEARRIIDARPQGRRPDDTLRETSDWAQAGHLFYFAGDLPTARAYYQRAVAAGDGSESDMISREHIAAIDGDVHAALREAQRRLQRYDDDGAAGVAAGYLFMAGRSDEAWATIATRMQTSTQPALWRAALAGHRIAHDPLAAMPAWLRDNKVDHVVLEFNEIKPEWLHEYAIRDRLPVALDEAAVTAMGDPHAYWPAGIITMRAALANAPTTDQQTLDRDTNQAGFMSQRLIPFYAWATWFASQGKEPALEHVRRAPIESGLWAALSKAMVLAADGRRDEALSALTAARWALGQYGTAYSLHDATRGGPYDFVLAAWLMTRKTGEPAYAREGLTIARAYQHVDGAMGWPYAAEALLSTDPKAREIAACRAQKLDADSLFLHESGLHPDPKSAACRKATAW